MSPPRSSGSRRAGNVRSRIHAAVQRIPRGCVASYGDVAAAAGLAGQARLVGYTLHAAPEGVLPWHRVVNAHGALSLAKLDPGGALTQRLRLEREGVTFDARGRVNLERHRWRTRRISSGA